MVGKNEVESDRTIEHANQRVVTAITSELFEAGVVLHSLVLLLRYYENDLGDDSDRPWVGLSMVLADVQKKILDARDAIETGNPIKLYEST